jgi:peptidoglycan/LPS O-acetylase OafA/YrhL
MATLTPTSRPVSNRMDQLDGLRAFAVLLTLLTHFTHSHQGVLRLVSSEHPGSRLFFMLSGFLITGLLLRYRDDINRWGVVGRFHIRRLLRTLPLYYLLLLGAVTVNMGHARDGFWWHATFLSNVYLELYRPPFTAVTHFWSLALQEQFYLLWPFIVLFVPRRVLLPIMAAFFAIGPVSRMAFLALGLGNSASSYAIGCSDTLAGGAILALLADRRIGDPTLRKTFVNWCFWLGVPAFALLLALNILRPNHGIFSVWSDTALALVYIWLIDRAARSIGGPIGALLDARPVRYVGQVSYGIYILHPFMSIILFYALKAMKVEFPDGTFWWFATLAGMSVAAASLSWKFVEFPINAFKEHFPYSTARKNERRMRGKKTGGREQLSTVFVGDHATPVNLVLSQNEAIPD